jgi:hypothetical protein
MSIFKFCAVCDEVRLEKSSNKSIIIGFYGMLPYVEVDVPNPSQPVQKLTFLFISGTPIAAGRYRVQVSIKDTNGLELADQGVPAINEEAIAGPLNVIITVQPMPLNGPGNYRVTAIVNDKEDFTADFVVGQTPAAQ